jgi:hypothetical protein
MSQRKSVLYVSNITSTVSGVSLGKFIGIKYCAWYIAFVAAEHILKSTGHLSTFLQGVKCDLVEAVKESEVVINQLTSERNDQTVIVPGICRHFQVISR